MKESLHVSGSHMQAFFTVQVFRIHTGDFSLYYGSHALTVVFLAGSILSMTFKSAEVAGRHG